MTIFNILLYLITILIFCIGIYLIHSTNTVYTLLSFLGLVLLLSGILVMLGTELFAILYTLIYIGVIMIFFMFTLMLVNMRFESRKMYSKPYLYILMSGFHIWLTVFINAAGFHDFSNLEDLTMLTEADLKRPWVDALVSKIDIENIGWLLYCKYGFLCFILALIILSVLIGSLTMIDMLKRYEKARLQSAALQKAHVVRERARKDSPYSI